MLVASVVLVFAVDYSLSCSSYPLAVVVNSSVMCRSPNSLACQQLLPLAAGSPSILSLIIPCMLHCVCAWFSYS